MPTQVLIIDDDKETTDLLKIILETDGFQVTTAISGRDGVNLAREKKHDVIIVDLLMPDMDGLKVCREVRTFSNVPLVVLSAVNKPGVLTRALDEGADDYLIKPIKSNILVACLNKLARRARVEQEIAKTNGLYRMK
jgi:two-component system KDP operon response regulator KdpE